MWSGHLFRTYVNVALRWISPELQRVMLKKFISLLLCSFEIARQ